MNTQRKFIVSFLLLFLFSCSKSDSNMQKKVDEKETETDVVLNASKPGPIFVDPPPPPLPPPEPLPPLTPDELYAMGKRNGCALRQSARTSGTQVSTIYTVITGYTSTNQPIFQQFSAFEIYSNTVQNTNLPWEYRMGFTDGWVECRFSGMSFESHCDKKVIVVRSSATSFNHDQMQVGFCNWISGPNP